MSVTRVGEGRREGAHGVIGVVVRLYGTCPPRLARLPTSMRDYRSNPLGLIARVFHLQINY